MEGIDREAVDQLAVVSQERAARAIAEGRFDKSVVPVNNPDGSLALDKEEFPRPGTTLEGLAKLQAETERRQDETRRHEAQYAQLRGEVQAQAKEMMDQNYRVAEAVALSKEGAIRSLCFQRRDRRRI